MRRLSIFLLNSKSKLSSVLSLSRNAASLMRRASRRSCRRTSSSLTRVLKKSACAVLSLCACTSRASRLSAMPDMRRVRSALSNSIMFIFHLLVFAIDEIAVKGQLSDERVDLPERQGRIGLLVDVALDEAVGRHVHLKSKRAGLLDALDAVPFGETEHALDALDAELPVCGVDALAH